MWRKLKRWSAMLLAAFLVFTSVQYTGLIAEAEGETATSTFTFSQLTKVGGWGNTDTVDANGKITVSFTGGQYTQIFFAIPDAIDSTKLEKVTFNGITGSSYGLKLLNQAGMDSDNKDAVVVDYGVSELATGGATDIKYIGIMSTAASSEEQPDVVTVDSISFTYTVDNSSSEGGGNDEGDTPGGEGGGSAQTPGTYSFADLTHAGGWGNTHAVDADGKITVTFTGGQYTQIFFAIPEAIDATKLEKVTFNGINGASYGLKLLNQAGMDSDNKDAVVVDYGVSELATGGATDIKYIGIMSTAASTEEQPDVVTVDSITFTVAADEGGDQPGGEGGEEEPGRVVAGDILANFNSNFENGYWWNDANWGQSAIAYTAYADGEAKPSATCGNQYLQVLATAGAGGTAMMCSADISALFTEGKNYEFSYLVKLAEGASGDVRFELFSQTSDYANDVAPTFVYDEESYTLSDSEWTLVSGTFEMCDTQDQMWVRFTSAAGVGFMIDDIRIGEVADEDGDEPGEEPGDEEEPGRVVAGDILANFNSNFENGYWWNDANWGQSAIAYTAYADGEAKPSATCGNQYLQVLATAEAGGTAMICSADISALFTEGKNYEFSYLVKLAEGATGDVTFNLYSQTSGYSNDTAPTFVYDEESYTLSDSEWTLVSGTFEMCDTQDQMVVKFTSVAGVSFMIDEIRIGELEGQGGDEPGDEPGEEEGEKVTYTFADLTEGPQWSNNATVDADGKLTVGFTGHYAQRYYNIPADIDMSKVQKVIIDGFEGSNYELRLLTQENVDSGFSGAAVSTATGNTLTVGTNTDVAYVGFACTSSAASESAPVVMKADSVTFVYYPEGEVAPTTSTVEYHFGDIPVAAGGYGHNKSVDEYNRLNLAFTQQYGEVKFAIPAELKDQIITGIEVTPVSGNTSTLAIKVYDTDAGMSSGAQMHVSWGGMKFTISPSKLVGVGFMTTDNNDAVASNPLLIKKITFTVQGDFEGGSDFLSEVSYNFNDLTAAGGWNQVSSVTAKDGKLTMNFAEKYGEVQFAIPDEMLGKNITKMSFSTSVGNAANLAVKLYAGDTEAVVKYGETSFDIATEEDITKFAFMLNSDDVSPIVIDKVTFVVEADVENGSEFITEAYTTVPAAALKPIISGNAEVLDAEVNGGKLGINFNEEGAAVFFAIPSYVDMSKVKYVDLEDVVSALNLVDTTYGTALNGVKLNAYTAADFATKTPTLTSDTSAVVTDGNANIKYIGLVSTAATASVSMTRVGFVEKNITKTGDMFSWTADDFVFDGTNSTASATAVDDNKWLCTFEEADDIAIFELPETFITGNAKDFAIAISKRDVPVVLSFLDAEMNEVWSTKNPERVQSYHNVDTVASRVDVKAKYLAISVKEGGAKMCVLDGMSANKRVFSNEPYVVPTYTILTYTAADVLKIEGDGWSGSGFEKLGETVKVNLPGTYGEVSFKLPVKIDLSQCETVNIKLKNQNLPIAVKLIKNYEAMVVNYDRILGERNFAPFSDAQINKFSLMSLESAPHSSAEFESITFTMKGDYVPEAMSSGGIIINGNFDDEDVSDWKAAFWDDVTITTAVSPTPIFGNVNTYGIYSKRTSPYQCFAQDITGRVQQDGTYTFSFWAKLSDDYKGAPDNQRVVQFSPYTVDVNGVADYNPNLQGVFAQTLEVGKWTKYEGTWKVTNANQIESVFVRILEQGTNYGQGDCVLGSYAITGVEIKEYIPDPPSIDEDVPDLKAALTQEFGDGFIVGTAITGNEFDDIGVEMLANKHFNAITLGNELKPDAMMGYSETHTALQTITFNGQKLVVPTLTFSSADAKLNTILKWNKKHPESPIKVRGHVLVWHSQTMEWFFRENYVIGQNADGSENYVTPEEMNLRLEWYIKTVLEHYTGEDSPYKDLFYGWDVVNEAVSDGTGTYRTDTVTKAEKPSDTRHGSNSSWWAVYKSNEFVIKAFQYANKYAPAELELYYNDYNDTETRKVKGIVQLLKDVLAAEGTRIDAMGMQAHYNLYNPGMGSLEQAIRQYCAVVGKVQLTELDLKASDYLGSDAALEREYASQALHYKKIHDLLLRLDAEDGIDITGVTFWGTIDTYSWLQEGSNVGGGSDGSMSHCPLLFDGNYKVKPAYWAWVDYSMVDPDYVADNTSGGSSTQNPDKDTDDKDETESTESVEQTESLTVPVIKDEEEKSSVAGPIAAVAGVVVVGAGLGAFFWNKKRKSIGE